MRTPSELGPREQRSSGRTLTFRSAPSLTDTPPSAPSRTRQDVPFERNGGDVTTGLMPPRRRAPKAPDALRKTPLHRERRYREGRAEHARRAAARRRREVPTW